MSIFGKAPMLSNPLDNAMRNLARVVVADTTLGDALLAVTESVKEVVPAAVAVGISMTDENGNLATPIYTDEVSPQVDAAQYESNRGPCLDAWRRARTVYVEDTTKSSVDYPEFSRAAVDHGIGSTLSVPLFAADRSLGGINLYAPHTHAFVDGDETAVVTLSAAAGVMLANASAYWEARTLGEHLDEAMKSRAVIEQAKGIVMALHSELDADGAFTVLRQMSQRENVKLRDVAARVVELRGLPKSPDNLG
jgi:GAF domain-containing protein